MAACAGSGLAASARQAPPASSGWRGPPSSTASYRVTGCRRRRGLGHRFTTTSGTLYELNPATGAVRDKIAIEAGLPHFSSLSLAGHLAYLDTLTGITAIKGA